jgi:hypothetical protein
VLFVVGLTLTCIGEAAISVNSVIHKSFALKERGFLELRGLLREDDFTLNGFHDQEVKTDLWVSGCFQCVSLKLDGKGLSFPGALGNLRILGT